MVCRGKIRTTFAIAAVRRQACNLRFPADCVPNFSRTIRAGSPGALGRVSEQFVDALRKALSLHTGDLDKAQPIRSKRKRSGINYVFISGSKTQKHPRVPGETR